MTIDEEKVLLGLVDTLLPGGAGFPVASATGMIQQVATRLCLVDVNLLKRLAAVFAARGGLPLDESGWHDAASRLDIGLSQRWLGRRHRVAATTFSPGREATFCRRRRGSAKDG